MEADADVISAPFKPGDRVRLRIGGPAMIVVQVTPIMRTE
jgi:uncharacterized protein YodC (DUF2158 family)